MKTQLISSSLLAAIALAPLTSAAIHRHHARDGWDTPHQWSSGHSYGGSSGDSSATTLSTYITKTVVATATTTTTVQAPTTAASTVKAAPTEPSSTPEAAPAESSTPSSTPEPSTTEAPTSAAVSAADDVATSSSSSSSSASEVSAASSSSSPLSLSRKSGLAGYVGIADIQAFQDLSPYISWYSDYTPTTQNVGDVKGFGMLWGSGQVCTANTDDAQRMAAFKSDVADNSTAPEVMFGFYEPDCYCPMSSDMSTSDGTALWNSLIAPLKAKGTILGSPSMCKQKDEDWLTPFSQGLDADWDVTSIHINKNSIDGVMEDVEYYVSTYGRPVFVSEFACVDDQNGFTACTDQGQINQFISDAVDFFQGNDSVIAYGPSNGEGLGTVWPLTDNGELSATGTAYLNKIKSL